MASRYLIEISPETMNYEDPLDLRRSFTADLTPEQLAGVYALGNTKLDIADIHGREGKIRVYGWDPLRGIWRLFLFEDRPQENNRRDITTGFDTSIRLGSFLFDPDEDNSPVAMYPRVQDHAAEFNFQPKKYVYGLIDEENDETTIHFYTSDTLELLQGIMSLAGWLGKDWRNFVKYIYEDGVPMMVG